MILSTLPKLLKVPASTGATYLVAPEAQPYWKTTSIRARNLLTVCSSSNLDLFNQGFQNCEIAAILWEHAKI